MILIREIQIFEVWTCTHTEKKFKTVVPKRTSSRQEQKEFAITAVRSAASDQSNCAGSRWTLTGLVAAADAEFADLLARLGRAGASLCS